MKADEIPSLNDDLMSGVDAQSVQARLAIGQNVVANQAEVILGQRLFAPDGRKYLQFALRSAHHNDKQILSLSFI